MVVMPSAMRRRCNAWPAPQMRPTGWAARKSNASARPTTTKPRGVVVVAGAEEGTFLPLACWPEGSPVPGELVATADASATRGQVASRELCGVVAVQRELNAHPVAPDEAGGFAAGNVGKAQPLFA